MPQLWQCDDCGARYRVNWLSHCYRCEGRPPKPRATVEKPSRRKKMPRIVTGVGPSNAWAELEKPLHAVEAAVEHAAEHVVAELRGEAGPELVALAKDELGPKLAAPVAVAEAVVAAVAAAEPRVAAPTPEPAPTAAPVAPAKETSA